MKIKDYKSITRACYALYYCTKEIVCPAGCTRLNGPINIPSYQLRTIIMMIEAVKLQIHVSKLNPSTDFVTSLKRVYFNAEALIENSFDTLQSSHIESVYSCTNKHTTIVHHYCLNGLSHRNVYYLQSWNM